MQRRIFFLVWLILVSPCRTEIIIVDDDGPADFNNIQAAIEYSNDWDTIYVFPGTYTGTGNRDIDFLGKVITVQSVAPDDPYIVAETIIDCDANESELHRGFYFHRGEGHASIVSGLTITGGYQLYRGGGIYCKESSPTIEKCVIRDCGVDGHGGGINCQRSSPEIRDCVISGNYSTGWGGGISFYRSSATLSNCRISENWVVFGDGGGVDCDESSPTISDCLIIGNSSLGQSGGGMSIGQGSGPTISDCIIRGNSAKGAGGIYCNASSPTISRCEISDNSAFSAGGVCLIVGSTAKVSDCVISGNSAHFTAGIACTDASPMITNCTVVGNWAEEQGGGVGCGTAGSPQITNCILWNNTPEEIWLSPWAPPSEPVITYSNVRGGWPGVGNIDDNPMFVRDPNDGGDGWGDDPCTPDVNEGTNDDFGDLHLEGNSPCINAGDPHLSAGPNDVDMDGQPRVMGFVIDMGAYEFFMPMIVVARPEGGEVWAGGSTHEIKWLSCSISGMVDILYSSNNGLEWAAVENNISNIGSYVWNLPDAVDSNQCLISVVPSVPDPNVVCIESGLFTIHPDFLHPAVPSKWKSLGGDFKRAGLSENYGPELGCVKWQFDTDGAVSASITIGAGDRVHIACEDGKVYTLDIDDGSLLWSYDTNSPLISAPTVGPRGTVFVGSENGKLYAISIGGTLRWTHTTDGFIYSSPAVSADGQVYVCSQDGSLYALGEDGSELWSFETDDVGVVGSAIFASPAIGADCTVYIAGLYDPNLYALDPNDGSVKWDCNFASGGWPFASPVVAADGTIYQTLLFDPNLYAIEPDTGTIIWSTDLADPESGWFDSGYINRCNYTDGLSAPALGPDGTIYVTFNDPYLRAVDPNGSIKWVTRLGITGCFTLTVGSDGLVYAADNDGYLSVVGANGCEVARFQSDGGLIFPVVSADNTIIVSDANSKILAVSGDDCQGRAYELHRAEDLDGNLFVNFMDFALLAADWLACNDHGAPCEALVWGRTYFAGDIDRNLYVDFADLAAMANRWLSGD